MNYVGGNASFRHIYVWINLWQAMGWNSIIFLAALTGVGQKLYEALAIDGANDLVVFLKIVIPLSVSTIAVMALFYGVGRWNSWFGAMLYLDDRPKYPM